MKVTIKLIFLMFMVLVYTSCTYVYYPTYPVVPDTKSKGTGVQGTVGFTRAQLSAWHAFDSNVYVVANVAGAVDYFESGSETSNRTYNAVSASAGAGYKLKANDHFEFQIQGGVGACKGYFHTNVFNVPSSSSSFPSSTTFDVETISLRGYLQPVLGFTHPKGGGFFLIPRITYENFVSVGHTNKGLQQDNILRPRGYLLTELYGMGRINAKVINIDIYAGLSTNLFSRNVNSKTNEEFVAQPFLFGLGVSKTFN